MALAVQYRHLFVLRAIVAGPADANSGKRYAQLANEAAKLIFPAIDVRNFGACGKKPEGKATAEQKKQYLERVQLYACTPSEADQRTLPATGKQMRLFYTPRLAPST